MHDRRARGGIQEGRHGARSPRSSPATGPGAWLTALVPAPSSAVVEQGAAGGHVLRRLGRFDALVEGIAPEAPTEARAQGIVIARLIELARPPQTAQGPLDWMDWEREKTLRLLREPIETNDTKVTRSLPDLTPPAPPRGSSRASVGLGGLLNRGRDQRIPDFLSKARGNHPDEMTSSQKEIHPWQPWFREM